MMWTSSTPASAGMSSTSFDHALTHVGRAHRRQRQRDVVERDGELHPRAQQRVQRDRSRSDAGVHCESSLRDRAAGQRLGGIDDASVLAGRRSRRKPSPLWNKMGGVDLSTSSTKPCRGGRCLAISSPCVALGAEVERDLDRAPRPGIGGVGDRVFVTVEWIALADQRAQVGLRTSVERCPEVVAGVGVAAADGGLTMPEGGEVEGCTCAGMPTTSTSRPGRDYLECLRERCRAADTIHDTVGATG